MYNFVLLIHSWLRWFALIAGFGATLYAVTSRTDVTGEGPADRWGLILMMLLDMQMLVGLLLYLGLSPFAAMARNDMAAAMKDPMLRFWGVEHITTMFVAIILAHVGRVLARRAKTPGAKRLRQIVCYSFATLAMLAGIPWPGMSVSRPLLRF